MPSCPSAEVQTEEGWRGAWGGLKGHKAAVLTWLHHLGGEQREGGETLQDNGHGADTIDLLVVQTHKHLSN